MKRVAFILIAVVALIALATFFLVWRATREVEAPPAIGGDLFPTFPDNRTSTEGLELTLRDGSIIVVPDFTAVGQPQWASELAGYEAAGSVDGEYHVVYIPPDEFGSQAQFVIGLQAEPLGEVRRRAENDLLERLRVSKSQFCGLDVQVWTTVDVNETYAGRNLGVSFCPGSVELP